MNEKYEKIIGMPHHVSKKHEPMKKGDRAAQFAPYAALSGYEDAVEETARLTDRKVELDEYEKERINAALISLLSAPIDTKVSITYFSPDRHKSGGAYIKITDEVASIDEVKREITMLCGRVVKIDDILNIQEKSNISSSFFLNQNP
jgi:hypothetical protein